MTFSPALRRGAWPLGYVVGDQASYLRVMIRTGQILAGAALSIAKRPAAKLFRLICFERAWLRRQENNCAKKSSFCAGRDKVRPRQPGGNARVFSDYQDVFAKHYKRGAKEVVFDREEIVEAAQKLGLPRPKNVGDVVYSFRFRKAFPESIKKTAPKGLEWMLGKSARAVTVLCSGKAMVDCARFAPRRC